MKGSLRSDAGTSTWQADTARDLVVSIDAAARPHPGSPITESRRQPARVAAVISSPDLGVNAVAAAGVLCAFCCAVDTLPGQCLCGSPMQSLLSLLFLELSGYYVNAVQLHVHAADVLVRCGIHREGFR